jgi:hypothetical protein
MRFAALASLSIASCILCFAACGGDDNGDVVAPTPDGSASSSSSSSSGGTSASSSSSSGSAGDDDDAGKPDSGSDAGEDAGQDGGQDAGPDPTAKLPPSCKATKGKGPGIDTCGAGETATDDCCTSLTLPKTTTRTLDKYEITAGRMRAFVEAVPNIRQFAKDFATAHPTSQLGKVATDFPAAGIFGGYLDTLPKQPPDASQELDEALFLGGFPVDAINDADGCYVSPGGYGAATYWQPPSALKPYGIGANAGDGTRKYGKDVLDTKALNCVSALMLAAFCAWDGGELARTSDFREVWGIQKVVLPGPGATVFVPWNDVLPWSQFNWRNGHDGACPSGWPGCVSPAQIFYSFPTPNAHPEDDDSPEIGAPGRFPKDVTKAVSADGGGWFDIGGNLMDLAWPNTALVPATKDFCDTSAGGGGGATACNRNQSASDQRPGTLRYQGNTPPVALVGYSFEVHARRSEKYLSSATDDETLIATGDVKPAHFQYGKIGGRCARVKP